MTQDSQIAEFIERALDADIPHQSVLGVLVANGWPEKEVYLALAEHYGRRTGIEVPRRMTGGTSAKEAFFYLLIFLRWLPGQSALGALHSR